MEINFKQNAVKWSKKELLGHLIDSAYNNHQRILRAERKGDLVFQGYDQDAWVKKNDNQNRDIDEILNLWEMVNQHLSNLIKGLPDSTLKNKTTDHNFDIIGFNSIHKNEESSLEYLI